MTPRNVIPERVYSICKKIKRKKHLVITSFKSSFEFKEKISR